jgi:hypothetical protein
LRRNIPVSTQFGELRGRDAIYLDGFASRKNGCELVLQGEINCSLADDPPGSGDFCPYELVFLGVIAICVTELDAYAALKGSGGWA